MNARLLSGVHIPAAVACLLACLGLGGCSLPKPQPDPTRFYLLSTEATPAGRPSDGPVVQLREVELASYLRTRSLVVRRGDHEVEFRDFALWGEPLELGIARVLREELLARGAAAGVTALSRRNPGNHDLSLTVRVLACEGDASGGVAFHAVWTLGTIGSDSDIVESGDYRAADLRWDGKSEASLAARISEAVAGLADEISAALAKQ